MLPTVYRFGRKKNHEKLLIVWEIAESFRARRMSCPTVGYSPWTNLLEMDGTLGITHADESSMVLKLWVCFQKQHWDRVSADVSGLWFKESLVRHDFFERQDGRRRRVIQPRFFSGL